MADRKQAIATLKIPEDWRQLREVLGITRFFRIWIPNFELITKLLWILEGTGLWTFRMDKGLSGSIWSIEGKSGFDSCTRVAQFTEAFQIVHYERQGTGLGVVTQTLENIPWPITYLSKKLDHMTKWWPPSLQTVSAWHLWHLWQSTYDILQESEEFTLE